MKKFRLITAILLIAAMTVSCGGAAADSTDVSEQTEALSAESAQTEAVSDNTEARVAVLSGTTGFGIAPLYMKAESGELENLRLKIDIYSDASLVSPLIISGNADIAAVPTNLASVLYNKTEGKIKVLAVNTLGVLYLLENGNTVTKLEDLKGKTVYVPGQGTNPEYVLRALLTKAGILDQVTIDYSYASPDELTSATAAGKVSIALLPEPKVTAVTTKNKDIRVALDISSEWKTVMGSELVQGCVIVRTAFLEEHPTVVQAFLDEYKKSVESVNTDADAAASAVVSAGIAASAALVKNALPRCNIVYLDDDGMKTALNTFWQSLYGIIPSSIGGKIPDENIFN